MTNERLQWRGLVTEPGQGGCHLPAPQMSLDRRRIAHTVAHMLQNVKTAPLLAALTRDSHVFLPFGVARF